MIMFVKAVLVSAALLMSVSAQERRTTPEQQAPAANNRAYYDSKHRDWHQWNDKEEQSYQRYAEEHHLTNHDFSKASERDQQAYWNWRHKHPE